LGQLLEQTAGEVERMEAGFGQREGALLNAFPKFVETNFLTVLIPQFGIERSVQGMDQDGRDPLAVEFAQQAVGTAAVAVMDAQHGFELFEDQLHLPAQSVESGEFGGGQEGFGSIGDQQGPGAQRQVQGAGSAALLAGGLAETAAPLLNHQSGNPQTDQSARQAMASTHQDRVLISLAGSLFQQCRQVHEPTGRGRPQLSADAKARQKVGLLADHPSKKARGEKADKIFSTEARVAAEIFSGGRRADFRGRLGIDNTTPRLTQPEAFVQPVVRNKTTTKPGGGFASQKILATHDLVRLLDDSGCFLT